MDLAKLGERTLWIDCDVLEADGGTRTAGITGAFVALVDALHAVQKDLPGAVGDVLTDSVAAVSVGVVDGEERLDLEYVEDRDAEVDLNLVMTGSGKFIEVQGTGEEATFTRKQLDGLLDLGRGRDRPDHEAAKAGARQGVAGRVDSWSFRARSVSEGLSCNPHLRFGLRRQKRPGRPRSQGNPSCPVPSPSRCSRSSPPRPSPPSRTSC